MTTQDELLDLVDGQDNVIGTILRKDAYAQNKTSSIRGVWLIIRTQDNFFWIPKRSLLKQLDPGFLEGSVVGHVSSGETYEQAMLRETQEELHLDITNLPYTMLGRLTPQDDGAFCMISVFELVVQAPFDINFSKADIDSGRWMYLFDLVDEIKQGVKIKKSLKLVLEKFYGINF